MHSPTGTTPPPQAQYHHWCRRLPEGWWDFDMTRGVPSSVDFPDYIGVESCVDMRGDADEAVAESDDRTWRHRRKEQGRRAVINERREYPPLIPLLARTENLHSHMPWVLTRHYTPDGRLILTEEKVRHHEYFRAHRHNGRLTLQLVPLDDEVSSYPPNRQCNDEYDGAEDVFEIQAYSTSPLVEDHNEHLHDEVEADLQEEEGEGEGNKGENGGGVGSKCLQNYNSGAGAVGSPPSSSSSTAMPCMFGVPLPALRQVHS